MIDPALQIGSYSLRRRRIEAGENTQLQTGAPVNANGDRVRRRARPVQKL